MFYQNQLYIYIMNKCLENIVNTFCNVLCVCLEISFLFFFLLYNIVLVLPYINMHLPWVYTCLLKSTILKILNSV